MLLDEEDKDLLESKWHLHPGGYMQKGGGKNKVFAHRMVLERKIGRRLVKGELCDHINRIKLDNRRSNLRVADMSLNSINRDMRPDNTTGYLGVHLYWPKKWQESGWGKRWTFRIWRKGHKVYYSKLYKTAEEASLARVEKLKEYS